MKKLLIISSCILCSSLFISLNAQYKYTILHEFNDTAGASPVAALVNSGVELYGMTPQGGAHGFGCIFSLDTNGNGFTDIHDFDSINGTQPSGSLIISADTLYGTTYLGGAHNLGTIFSIQTNGSNFKKLFDFDSIGGSNPGGSLTLDGNILYGIAPYGGDSNMGDIFQINTDGSNFSTVLLFDNLNCKLPSGTLTLSGTTLYAGTLLGGKYGNGCVFKVQTTGNSFTVLCNFKRNQGYNGNQLLISPANNTLFGNAFNNGPPGPVVFKLEQGDTSDVSLYTGGPLQTTSTLVMVDSLVYMCYTGGQNRSTIISIDTGTAYKNTLYVSDTNTGWQMYGPMIYANHSFYGMFNEGPGTISGYGVIFKLQDTASIATGVSKLISGAGIIKVCPNPNNGQFVIASEANQSLSKIEIYNVLGQLVLTQFSIINSQFSIDLRGKSNGVYFYRAMDETGKEIGSGKVIIQP